MKKIEIYDPALCCSSGACGPSPDTALAAFSSTLKQLQDHAHIVRYNLAQEPGAFAANTVIKDVLETDGPDALPVILIEGKLAMKGVYPTEPQLRKLLVLPEACCEEPAKGSGKNNSNCCEGDSCC